jgi:uncharacterized RDD family membrane protein YckC
MLGLSGLRDLAAGYYSPAMTEPDLPRTPVGYPPPGYAFPPPPPPPTGPGGVPLATVWERFAAYAIDVATCAVANVIPVLIFGAVVFDQMRQAYDKLRVLDRETVNGQIPDFWPTFRHILLIEGIGIAILLPISMAITYLYFVTYMHRAGQTFGKRAMKITIVDASDGSPITKAQARKRWLVEQPAGLLAPYFSYADGLWLLWDKPYQQCLHDKCAETVVVKINRE